MKRISFISSAWIANLSEGRGTVLKDILHFPTLHPIAKRLLIIRGLRSLGQGAMVVDLTLYLKALHWNGAAIGGVTSAAGLFGAALILVVGILSDRLGRRPFLLIYEILTFLSALAACLTSQAFLLVFAIVVAGFGRGQSGAAGPFSPAEQAWLARHVDRVNRGQIFSLNNAIGFAGMAIGAAIGGVPALIHTDDPIVAYRPVFLVVAVVSIVCTMILLRMREENKPPSTIQGIGLSQSPSQVQISPQEPTGVDEEEQNRSNRETSIRRKENRSMIQLALVNALNGLAVGLTGPMMAYWFSLRYGVSSAEIGATLAVGFLLTGVSSILNGFLAGRFGMVKTVTWMRIIGSAMMLALPFMPNFATASVLYIVRGAINRGTQGNRSALSASLTRDSRRGLATSVNALSMRLPSSIGPSITGYLFDIGQLGLPLILTATLQLANAAIYQWLFGRFDGTQKPKTAIS